MLVVHFGVNLVDKDEQGLLTVAVRILMFANPCEAVDETVAVCNLCKVELKVGDSQRGCEALGEVALAASGRVDDQKALLMSLAHCGLHK